WPGAQPELHLGEDAGFSAEGAPAESSKGVPYNVWGCSNCVDWGTPGPAAGVAEVRRLLHYERAALQRGRTQG
ncbi:unnamed protein product, partial [Nesidiocoris tenuis]